MRRDHVIPPASKRTHAALDAKAISARIQQVRIVVDVETGVVGEVRKEIATEETCRRCGLKVHAANYLLFVAVVWNCKRIATASVRIVRGVCHRQQFQQLERERAEKRRSDLVVYERGAELLRRTTAARG